MNVYQGMRVDGNVVVTCNGRVFSAEPSLQVRNHSPAGFNWGYGGSGPAQLALAICMRELPLYLAVAVYQDFKAQVVARFDRDWFILTGHEFLAWWNQMADGRAKGELDAPDLEEERILPEERPVDVKEDKPKRRPPDW